ncbi:uncharacterized protein LOC125686436 [Lagopus muta]|uniref:uncharacterized protein LOC125686436 n=1 Tax=Lagopus muta TaxID=64668 RepID=UPI00209FEA43|nr:uncharacterized protein LOC125686436 [Lagopus muta]
MTLIKSSQLRELLLSSEANVWVTWANRTNHPDFCLSLKSAGEPFRTCLIGWPDYDLSAFQHFVYSVKKCNYSETATRSACLIGQLNNTLPWDPQELDLLGSRTASNASGDIKCLLFGPGSTYDKFAMRLTRPQNPLSPYYGKPWTSVFPRNVGAFAFNNYCGGNFSIGNAYGLRYTRISGRLQLETLVNMNTAKALPPGIFLICGDRAWAGVPKNIVGGPCYLGKLTLFAPRRAEWMNINRMLSGDDRLRDQRSAMILAEDCRDEVQLWTVTANIFASILAPGLAAAQALKQIERLACWTVKQSNITSQILEEMLEDMDSLRHAVLQNRAAIDFLLLAQGHGCTDFEGMCCFNLSDHSDSIHKQIRWLLNHTQSVSKDHNPIDDWLHSTFPGLSSWAYGLIKEGLRWLLILLLIIIGGRIVYGCLQRAIDPPRAMPVFSTTFSTNDFIQDWLKEQGGHNSLEYLEMRP